MKFLRKTMSIGITSLPDTVKNAENAYKLNGFDGSYYLNRANHTGTQPPSTISPQGDNSGLDADMVDGFDADDFIAISFFFGG